MVRGGRLLGSIQDSRGRPHLGVVSVPSRADAFQSRRLWLPPLNNLVYKSRLQMATSSPRRMDRAAAGSIALMLRRT